MSISPAEVVKQIQQVPNEFAHHYINFLVSLLRNIAELAEKQQARFRTVPFLPSDMKAGRDEKIAGADLDYDKEDKHMRGPGS